MTAPASASTLSELRQSLEALRKPWRKALFFGIVAALLMLVPTFYMFEVYGRVVDSRSHTTLGSLTIITLFMLGIMELLHWAQGGVLQQMARGWDAIMIPRIFSATYAVNLRHPGGTGVQPMRDWQQLRDFVHSPFIQAVIESPVAVVFLLLLFLLHPLMGGVALGAALLQTLLAYSNERGTQPALAQANRAGIEAQQFADNSLRNTEVVAALGMLPDVHKRWLERQGEMLKQQATASERAAAFQTASKVLQLTLGSAMLGIGAWLVLEDALPGGPAMMIVASVLAGRILGPFVQAITQWRSLVTVRESWRRLNSLLSDVPAAQPAMSLPAPKARLSVETLVAAAPGGPGAGPGAQTILKGLQFSLEAGDGLAVVGPSASGKTTLARLLVGLWPALQGKVRLDGADVFSWDKTELGPHIGYLPQGVELTDGSLLDNICRFGEPDPVKLQTVIETVGLQPLIDGLPQGLDTPLGADGMVLSGGQRQRVALARALYGDPVLIVLDEPNASLDETGDQALVRALAAARQRGAVLVVMTHRTNVLGVVNKMLVLRDGQQVAFGPRDDVLRALQNANAPAAQSNPALSARPAQQAS